jgi:hypothetical protein
MANPAGSGYRSPLKLGLDQLPKTGDMTLFNEFVPIYNAIHILNAYLDSLRLTLEGGDPEKPPSEEFRFVRGFWLDAFENIPQGSIVTIRDGKIRLGCGKRTKVVGTSHITDSFLTGIAMGEGVTGEKVRIGIGPAILNVPGYEPDDEVWATPPGGDFAGQFLATHIDGAIRIGKAVSRDYIMIPEAYLNL